MNLNVVFHNSNSTLMHRTLSTAPCSSTLLFLEVFNIKYKLNSIEMHGTFLPVTLLGCI